MVRIGSQMDSEQPFLLTLLSVEPDWIRAADAAGVQRIGVDIERYGKGARQRNVADARISLHELTDLAVVRAHVRQASLFARLNPLHPGTEAEVETALRLGARTLMLPFFRSADEPAAFLQIVSGRAEVILLVETGSALARLHEVLALPGITEIMLGLNDLHLDLGLESQMEMAGSDLLEWAGQQVTSAGLRFGFGGIALPHTPGLPVDPDLLLARYAQVGARSAWISRSLLRSLSTPDDLVPAIRHIEERLDYWFSQPPDMLRKALVDFRAARNQ